MQIHQPQFEWASAMLYNCARCRVLSPEFVEDKRNVLFDYHWTSRIGKLPEDWNHCVSYAETKDAKLYHWTAGIPVWEETRCNPEDAIWGHEFKRSVFSVGYQELMGNSVHEPRRLERLAAKKTSAT
jgi:hypothetical protein